MHPNKILAVALAAAALLTVSCAKKVEEGTTSTTGGTTSTAPSGEAAAKRDSGLVRFIHAHPGAPAMDLWFGGVKEFAGATYKTVTAYKQLPNERREFRLREAGKDASVPLTTNSEGVADGRRYTVVVLPLANGGPTIKMYRDDLGRPDTGKAEVRIIHAAANFGDLDVVEGNKTEKLFDGVDYNSATGFEDVTPFQGTLEISKVNTKTVLLRIPNVNLQAGHLYTFVLTRKSPDGPMEAVSIDDQMTTMPATQ